MNESTSSVTNERLDAIIADCYIAQEQGRAIDREALLAANPDLQVELKTYFADLDRLDGALRGPFTFTPPSHLRGRDTPTATGQETNPPPRRIAVGSAIKYFGEYEVLGELGAGGMGVVFKARQTRVKRVVALKMIRSGQLASSTEVQRFHDEARRAARLQHANIVAVHEVGEHQGHQYFTMDFVAGPNLSEVLGQNPLPPRRAAELVKEIASAVEYAHTQGVVHRDLKPANILLSDAGVPRVTDFGLSKDLWDSQETSAPSLTHTGDILGTAGYMSPEQASGLSRLVGPAADIYALGAVLYALLTQRAPFAADTRAETIQQVIHREPVAPSLLNPAIPRDLETICLKCLQKESHKRYGTAQLLADDLQRFLENRPVVARPISRLARGWRWCRRNPLVAALSTAVAVSLILGTVVSTAMAIVARQRGEDLSNALVDKTSLIDNRDTLIRQLEASNTAKDIAIADKDAAILREQSQLKAAEENLKTAQWNTYVAKFYNLTTAWKNREWGVLDRMLTELSPKVGEPDFRGWEWHYLRDQYRQKIRVLSPERRYSFARWSPNGKMLAARRDDSCIEIWSFGGKRLAELPSSADKDFAWSPDSTLLASSNGLLGVQIWNVASATLTQELKPHSDQRKSSAGGGVDWSRDGKYIIQSGCGWIDVWNPDGQKVRSTNYGHVDGVNHHTNSIHAHPTEPLVALACCNGYVRVVNFESGKSDWFKHVCTIHCQSVRWNCDGTQLAVGTGYPTYRTLLFDRDGEQMRKLDGHDTQVMSLAWQEQGSQLICVGTDHRVSTWNATEGRMESLELLHNGVIHDVDVRAGSTDVVTVGQDKGIRLWNANSDFLMTREAPTGLNLQELHWNPKRPWIATLKGNDAVIVDLATGLEIRVLTGRKYVMNDVAWHPDGKLLAGLDNHGEIRIWDVESGELLNTLAAGSAGIGYFYLQWSPDGRYLASSGNEWAHPGHTVGVYVFDLSDIRAGKTPIFVDEHYRGSMAWSPDSKRLVVGDFHAGSVTLWDMETRKILWTKKRTQVVHMAYRPDGKQVAACHTDGSFSIWDVSDGGLVKAVHRHSGEVVRLYWCPDSSRFVTSSFDGSIRIWDSLTCDELLSLPVFADRAISWNGSGSQIVTGGRDQTLRVWGPSSLVEETKDAPPDVMETGITSAYAEGLLRMNGTVQIDGEWIHSIEKLPPSPFSITGVNCRSALNNNQLKFLLARTKLTHLEVPDLTVSLETLRVLSETKPLESLLIPRANLTDEAVDVLANMQSLKLLNIQDTAITSAGIQKLRAALPKTEICWVERADDRSVAAKLLAKRATLAIQIAQQRLSVAPGEALPTAPFRLLGIKAEPKETLTIEDFTDIEKLADLESIEVLHTRLDDALLRKLKGLTKLKYLGCGNTTMTGLPLQEFEPMPLLETIVFGGSLANDSLVYFNKFPNLQTANLSWTEIDDSGVLQLPALSQLKRLSLNHTKVTGPGLENLKQCSSLEVLNLSQTPLTDEGLRHLTALSTLVELSLGNTSITGESAKHLANFKSLKKLDLSGTNFTKSQLSSLRSALPGCVITMSPAPTP